MFETVPSTILGSFRDRVRDARHVVRSVARAERTELPPLAVARQMARMSDGAFSRAEQILLRVAPAPLQVASGKFCPSAPASRSISALRAQCYRLLKSLTAAMGDENALIHESRLATLPNHAAMMDPAAYGAGIATALMLSRPLVRGLDGDEEAADRLYVLAGLGFAACLYNDEPIGYREIARELRHASAALAGEIDRAMGEADIPAGIETFYRRRAPHLP